MLISQQLKKTNIAEYILYMWQIEDTIRACNFDLETIKKIAINQQTGDKELVRRIENWFSDLIQMMQLEQIEKKGHLQIIQNRIIDVNDLHLRLLQMPSEGKYKRLFAAAYPFIRELEQKSDTDDNLSDVELCLNGLYGILLIKLSAKELSESTRIATKTFSDMLAYLTRKYVEYEKEPDAFL